MKPDFTGIEAVLVSSSGTGQKILLKEIHFSLSQRTAVFGFASIYLQITARDSREGYLAVPRAVRRAAE